jgi:hypothetical protein
VSVYRVYLKRKTSRGSEVFEKTTTGSAAAAEAAYRELLRRTEFAGQNVAAVLSRDNRHLYYHRFDRGPGDADHVAPDAPLDLHAD